MSRPRPTRARPARALGGFAALALLSLVLVGATGVTYRNAFVFARERLIRAGLAYSVAFEHAARRAGPGSMGRFDELVTGATGEGVRGVAALSGAGAELARTGDVPEGDLAALPWVRLALDERQLATGPEDEALFTLAVPTRLGCGPPHGPHGGRPPFPPDRGGSIWPRPPDPERSCAGRGVVLVLTLDPDEARAPVQQARVQAALVGVALVGAWALAWRFRIANRRTRRLEEEAGRREKLAALGEMAAVLAHEIRNPLGAIRGHAQLVAARIEENERARRSLDTIVHETSRLAGLVDGLLRYARPQEPRLQTTAVGTLVERVLGLVREDVASGTEVALRRTWEGEGPIVAADPDQLEQVLLNLVRNAVQAQPAGGTVEVGVAEHGRSVMVRVDDAGPGIPVADRERVFAPFWSGRAAGTGLGLAIARQIVEAHGGTLRVEESPLGGAALVTSLPVGAPSAPVG